MDYDLIAPGHRLFEHLAQNYARDAIGPAINMFGDGPDGGREATWEGTVRSLTEAGGSWDGYGVIQAKARLRQGDPADNLRWIKAEITKEASAWTRKGTTRKRVPDFLVFITNVRLSPGADGGVDQIQELFTALRRRSKLRSVTFACVHYDDLRVWLDGNSEVRRSYAAWITPGDLLASLLEERQGRTEELKRALLGHAARSLIDDNHLNLSQAGRASETPSTVAEVFTDLPFAIDEARNGPEEEIYEFDGPRTGSHHGVVPMLIDRCNTLRIAHADLPPHVTERRFRAVLVGGPGQGKSTVTQYLAQLYRAQFVDGTGTANEPEVHAALSSIRESAQRLECTLPAVRRWPIRITMTRLADSLSSGRCDSLLGFIAGQVSERSSCPVTAADLRGWLKIFPWLLLVDGLDEVPESSNRDQVLKAIRDFFIEAATIGGDVTTVATTRPQGYSNEFDPTIYSHFVLEPLSRPKAIEFAGNFIRIRLGKTERGEQLLDKFIAATSVEATQRLLGSPLQVTIMVVLLERLGRTPSDRFRLFHNYYRVIFQREQEKGGELAALLQEHEQDVDSIHRTVGYLLHERAARAGATSSSIAFEELERLIQDRLIAQGYEGDAARELQARFSKVITERLVFLARLRSNEIGFEVRSLQEYMAAEKIGSLPEAEVVPHIAKRARSSHWKNVVLFALGKIFAEREMLKDSVLVMCEELDSDALPAAEPARGAEIALGVLADGACSSQPRYERLLASRAVHLVDEGSSNSVGRLARLSVGSAIVRARVNAKLEESPPKSATAAVNRLLLADELANLGLIDHHALEAVLEEVPDGLRAIALHQGRFTPGRPLAEVLSGRPDLIDPTGLFGGGRPMEVRGLDEAFPSDGSTQAAWLDAALQLAWLYPHSERSRRQILAEDEDGVSLHILVLLGAYQELWERVETGICEDVEAWTWLKRLAAFCAAPSGATLAAFVRGVSVESMPLTGAFAHRVPWVVRAVVSSCSSVHAVGGADAFTAWQEVLAASADDGSLGEFDDWLAAQEAWLENRALLVDRAEGPVVEFGNGLSASLPLWHGMAGSNPSIEAVSVGTTFDTDGGYQKVVAAYGAAIARWSARSEQAVTRPSQVAFARVGAGIACSLGDLVHGDGMYRSFPREERDAASGLLAQSAEQFRAIAERIGFSAVFSSGGMMRLSWFGLIDPGAMSSSPWAEYARVAAGSDGRSFGAMGLHARRAFGLWRERPGDVYWLRLAVRLGVREVFPMVGEAGAAAEIASVAEDDGTLSVLAVLTASVEAVSAGELDSSFRAIAAAREGDLLLAGLADCDENIQRRLRLRGAFVLLAVDPLLSTRLLGGTPEEREAVVG